LEVSAGPAAAPDGYPTRSGIENSREALAICPGGAAVGEDGPAHAGHGQQAAQGTAGAEPFAKEGEAAGHRQHHRRLLDDAHADRGETAEGGGHEQLPSDAEQAADHQQEPFERGGRDPTAEGRPIGISNRVFERRRTLAKRDIETTTACRERARRGFSGLTRV
jgi:hypothetical protein